MIDCNAQDPRRNKLPHLTKWTKVNSLVLLLKKRKADSGKPKKNSLLCPLSAFRF